MSSESNSSKSESDETLSLGMPTHGAIPEKNPVGQLIGDYELLQELARGGMGIVYRARQISLNRIVALKMIRQAKFASESDRQRFQIEAEAAATLTHPNTVPIFEIGEFEGDPFYSMRLIEGGSLTDGIARSEWPCRDRESIEKSIDLIWKVAHAVHDAHQHGIIHRDLKPGNILLDGDGTPFVSDFGLAKRFESADDVTQSGVIVGTPAYMAPEQALGGRLTTAADIYGLGAILYRLLGGSPPFEAASPAEALKQLLGSSPKPLRKLNQRIDRDLETICHKCLEKNPSQRYSSALALANDLGLWKQGRPIAARPIGWIAKSIRWGRRNPLGIGVVLFGCFLLSLIVGSLILGYASTRRALDVMATERYANAIWSAAAALRDGDAAEFDKHLRTQIPDEGALDRRGWEWHYLQRKNPIEGTLPRTNQNRVWRQSAYSPKRNRFAILESEHRFGFELIEVSIWDLSEVGQSETSKGDPSSFAQSLERQPDSVLKLPSIVAFANRMPALLEWDPHGKYLALQCDQNEIQIWDVDQCKVCYTLPVAQSNLEPILRWSHKGDRFAVAEAGGDVFIHRLPVDSNVEERPMKISSGDRKTAMMGWSPTDDRIAISSANRTRLIDTTTWDEVQEWPFQVLEWSPDGNKWASYEGVGSFDSPKPQWLTPITGRVAWSHNGDRLASKSDNELTLLDTNNGTILQNYTLPGSGKPLWLPSNDQVWINNDLTRDLRWSPTDRIIEMGKVASRLRASRDGRQVAVIFQGSNAIEIYDENGDLRRTLENQAQNVVALDWNSHGTQLASLDLGGILRIWDVGSGEESGQFTGLPAKSATLPFQEADWQVWWSPDDKHIAASAAGIAVRVWSTERESIPIAYDRAKVRTLGWTKEPLTLVNEVYEMSYRFPRTRNSPDWPNSSLHRIVSWDAGREKWHAYTLSAVSNLTQISQIVPGQNQMIAPSWNGVVREGLEAWGESNEIATPLADGKGPFAAIDLMDDPMRLIGLTTKGVLQLIDLDRNVTVMRLPKVKADSRTSYASGNLWIADGTLLHLLDGRPQDNDRASRLLQPLTSQFPFSNPILSGSLLFCVVFGPLWIGLDRGIALSYIRRWGIAVLFCALFLVLWVQLSPPHYSTLASVQILLTIPTLLIALATVGFFTESLRLTLQGKWLFPVAVWMIAATIPIYSIFSYLWPSAQTNAMKTDLIFLAVLLSFAGLGIQMVLLRWILWFNTGPRAASLRFVRAPSWVRFAMWGSKSTTDSILGIVVSLLLSCFLLIVYGLSVWQGNSIYSLMIVFAVLGGLLLAKSIWDILAIRWILRHGGWSNQLEGGKEAQMHK